MGKTGKLDWNDAITRVRRFAPFLSRALDRQPDLEQLLAQVKVNEATKADDLFTRWMGEDVEPRREFIQDNALSVANLDF